MLKFGTESIQCGNIPINDSSLLLGQWDFFLHASNVDLAFEILSQAAVFWEIPVTPSTSHSVRTGREKRTGAIAMAEIVIFPGLASSGFSAQNSILVDEHFCCVSQRLVDTGIYHRFCKLRRCHLSIVLR